jgi:hypothetical protein
MNILNPFWFSKNPSSLTWLAKWTCLATGKLGRGLSVFLLKTDGQTVTVTFQADPDGGSIAGNLTTVTPP